MAEAEDVGDDEGLLVEGPSRPDSRRSGVPLATRSGGDTSISLGAHKRGVDGAVRAARIQRAARTLYGDIGRSGSQLGRRRRAIERIDAWAKIGESTRRLSR